MSGQLTICFSKPESAAAPALATPNTPQPRMETREQEGRGEVPPDGLPLPQRRETGLPAMRLFAGYEMYRDECRTVIRKPGEIRWSATTRTGPTTHRFVGAGPDPAALWRLAAGTAGLVDQ
jgi:hypothetical protein